MARLHAKPKALTDRIFQFSLLQRENKKLEKDFLDTLELIKITEESSNPQLFLELESDLKSTEKIISVL